MTLELRHLRYFLAVAEAESFTRAAEQSYVAQSALSEQIARLEAEVGVPLFERTTRRVRLTPAGETLRPLAMRVLDGVEHAQEEMAALTGLHKGRLRLGTVQSSAGPVDLVRLVSAFRARHPSIELHVNSGPSREIAEAVGRGELDLAIIGSPPQELPSTLTHTPVMTDPLVAVLSADAAHGATRPISFEALVQRGPFIFSLPGSCTRSAVDAALARAGQKVEPTFELNQLSDMFRMATAGIGVTALPRSATGGARNRGAEVIELSDRECALSIGMVYDERRMSPAASAMLELAVPERARG